MIFHFFVYFFCCCCFCFCSYSYSFSTYMYTFPLTTWTNNVLLFLLSHIYKTLTDMIWNISKGKEVKEKKYYFSWMLASKHCLCVTMTSMSVYYYVWQSHKNVTTTCIREDCQSWSRGISYLLWQKSNNGILKRLVYSYLYKCNSTMAGEFLLSSKETSLSPRFLFIFHDIYSRLTWTF